MKEFLSLNVESGQSIPVEVNPNVHKTKSVRMHPTVNDFPVISTEDAVQALTEFSKKSCFYKRSCLDSLRILNVGFLWFVSFLE